MSQYYPPQQPPPQPGHYPPPRNPESGYEDEYDDYEYEDEGGGGSAMPFVFGCFSGGCLIVLGLAVCLFLLVGLWVLDPGADMFATTYPGDDIGLTFDDPARSNEAIVSEQGLRLSVIDVNRNAASNTIPEVDGAEIIIITVELENLSAEDVNYDDEREFKLLNQTDGFYDPQVGAIEGALGFGTVPVETGTQGRLVFQVLTDETGLVLEWQPPEGTAKYIEVE
ncbi:DUF4352 domain-containing protein [Anaerolineales bacterium HSG6]|nr:DUF4352 domain-containing protein [Anaerolineales bacterium HSG6]MDM8530666.1 DUF4352 domain-containing protein [Anaerolineales bacterium HSG25]